MTRRFVAPLLQRFYARRWALLGLFCGIGIPLLLFGSLAEDVWTREGFSWDTGILLALHARATPALDRLMLTLTAIGGPLPMAALAGAIALFLVWRRWLGNAALFATIVGGAALLNLLAKLLFQRQRPTLWPSLAPETDYGFPSGHAMGSMALVAALVFLLWGTRWRWPVLVVGTIFVLGVGLSRLYLGVHYPSDILAGWSASLAWACGVRALWRVPVRALWRERAALRRPREVTPSR
jgi:membrane-associated phospholipid phosphatase